MCTDKILNPISTYNDRVGWLTVWRLCGETTHFPTTQSQNESAQPAPTIRGTAGYVFGS